MIKQKVNVNNLPKEAEQQLWQEEVTPITNKYYPKRLTNVKDQPYSPKLRWVLQIRYFPANMDPQE
jgi:hypothetical protein